MDAAVNSTAQPDTMKNVENGSRHNRQNSRKVFEKDNNSIHHNIKTATTTSSSITTTTTNNNNNNNNANATTITSSNNSSTNKSTTTPTSSSNSSNSSNSNSSISSNNSSSNNDVNIGSSINPLSPSQATWVFQGCLVHATREHEMLVMEAMVMGVRSGKILFVEPSDKIQEVMSQYNLPHSCLVKLNESQFLMPGFVDCHAHASQYSFLGTGTDMELISWLNKYTFPAERRLKDEPDGGYEMYTKCVDRTLQCGTTTISYYATIDYESTMALVRALESRGQRAFVGKVNMDMNGPEDYLETREQSVKDTQRFVSDMIHGKKPLISPCITPRFALSCSMDLMKDLARIAHNHGLPIQTHLSENLREIEAVANEFPNCESYTHVYDEAGLLGDKTMLAHAVHVSRQELDLLRRRRSGICHCPNSNFSLTSGVMDLHRVMDAGVKVGLGTDFGAGNSPSMLDAIRKGLDVAKLHQFERMHKRKPHNGDTQLADSKNTNKKSPGELEQQQQQQQQQQQPGSKASNTLTYKHLFRLATLGSSEVMGLDEKIGNFQPGKDFDAILVDVSASGTPIDVFPSDSREDVVQKFIFLGDDRNILRVFVQGRKLIDRTTNN